jgi:beta-phosphoglucomutase-like phosphatase (HAD superfamily)
LILTKIIRSVFKKYGYSFLKTEYLSDKNGKEYATISIVTEEDLHKKILFMYLADEIARTHILTEENIIRTIKSCESILKELNGRTDH